MRILPPDDEQRALEAAARFEEPRARHYWDGGRHLSAALAEALRITPEASLTSAAGEGLAWDVYLAYRRGEARIGEPQFWMHQLNLTHAPRLDAKSWRERIERMLLEGEASSS